MSDLTESDEIEIGRYISYRARRASVRIEWRIHRHCIYRTRSSAARAHACFGGESRLAREIRAARQMRKSKTESGVHTRSSTLKLRNDA